MWLLYLILALAALAGSFYAGARYGRLALAAEQSMARKLKRAATIAAADIKKVL